MAEDKVSNEQKPKSTRCGERTEVYSRVVGYFRPVQQWNKGKAEEFKDRKTFVVKSEDSNGKGQSLDGVDAGASAGVVDDKGVPRV